MDISAYNTRQAAEDGVLVTLCDPYTGKVLEDGAGFMVRGIAARSVQQRLAEAQLAAKQAAQDPDDNMDAVLERLHAGQIEAAMKYIIEARNLTNGDKEVKTEADIRAVLDMTFPDMQIEKDANGKPLSTIVKGKDGKEMSVPQFEVVNKTFAAQVIEAAEDQRAFLSKRSTG